MAASLKILVANIGSTSFKYRLFDMAAEQVLAQGRVERIGRSGGDCPDYETAIGRCLAELAGEGRPLAALSALSAVGFKAVHAGPLSGARPVDDQVLAAMEEYAFLAPAHNPPYVAAMRAFRRTAPGVPLVALLETAFFDRVPESATTYAVPWDWKQELGVRRYGFHGASHRAASERAQALLGRTDLRHVSCHLGGSSSVAAVRAGVAVDCSFGMSPQSGLPHNDRVGDLDVFAALHVMRKRGLGVDEMEEAATCATCSRPPTPETRAPAWRSTSSWTPQGTTSAPSSCAWAGSTSSAFPAGSARTARGSARPCAPDSPGSGSSWTSNGTPRRAARAPCRPPAA
jgi:acetate kinase